MHEPSRQAVQLVAPIADRRFFTIPTLGATAADLQLKAYLVQSTERIRHSEEGIHIMRYAAYIRVSDEEQVNGYSLDAQRRLIHDWVASRGGTVVRVYADEGESARTADRTAFQKMRLDARNSKFDAVVVHKFDRFARNRFDSLAIKSLLRYDYKIKVFSVTEPSEDSDGPIGALIEGIIECVADWYSRNLATEVAKGKRERARQGLHNNRASFGYDKDENKILVPNAREAPGLIMAYTEFSTGKYSDGDIAVLLTNAGYRTKNGRPFSKETVREMLQNQTYLGKVRYQEYRKDKTRLNRSRIPDDCWYPGQHQPLISQELFDKCQQVRRERASHRQATPKYNPYLLRNLVYCYRCCQNPPTDYTFPAYGKMRAQVQGKRYRYYLCRAKDFNRECEQKSVHCDQIEAQVLAILMTLKPSAAWQQHITEAMSNVLGEQNLEQRLGEIKAAIERMDFRWDQGFITDKLDYLEKRVKLQQELEQLTPIPEDDLERAADMLENFGKYWDTCNNDPEAQHRLIKLIVERVYVQDQAVVAMTLKADYHIVLGHKANGSTEISVDPSLYTHGDDGEQTPMRYLGVIIVPYGTPFEEVQQILGLRAA